MFITRKRLEHMEATLQNLQCGVTRAEDRCWELWHRHERLLKHLGLSEHKVEAMTELRSKGGPEPGDQ